jgi:hypothetical protein
MKLTAFEQSYIETLTTWRTHSENLTRTSKMGLWRSCDASQNILKFGWPGYFG